MKKCECGHPSVFHSNVDKPKTGWQKSAAHIRERVWGMEEERICMGEINNKPCPCRGYAEDV